MNEKELMAVDGGGWKEVGQALVGTMMIASAPIVGVVAFSSGQPGTAANASKKMVNDGWGLIKTASENAYN